MALSPMMRQYKEIKAQYADCILFFRLGDFYEMFFEDAYTASRELELTLTGKNCGEEERAPMCGVPFHAADIYIARLVERGYKVAICEQTEDPAQAKGLVSREVIRIVTPGTLVDASMLDDKENNYLASVFIDERGAGFAYCDISTGELCASSFGWPGAGDTVINEIVRINAREVILNESSEAYFDSARIKNAGAYLAVLNRGYYSKDAVSGAVKRQFGVSALSGLGLDEGGLRANALGALFLYILETQKQDLTHISRLSLYETGSHMSLDRATIRNLEITETLYDKKVQGSLFGVLDRTNTAMGGRRLKQWLREPLNDPAEINRRLDAVEVLADDVLLANDLSASLKRVYDLERLAGRIACGNANARDLIALRNSVAVLPEVREDLRGLAPELLAEIRESIDPLEDVHDLIDRAICEDPPFTVKEGGIIRPGYSEELDGLKSSIRDAQDWISGLEGTERERTGIKNLKVGFNKVFGYYIEVTKSFYDMIPENYIRKQTLVNCERFITPELKETESLVLNAEAKINKMEYELFSDIRQTLQESIRTLQDTAQAVASLDALISYADVSVRNGYVKPKVNDSDIISIAGGRHPVVEQTINDGQFVANDTYIDRSGDSLLLITGPNMAGKSTYMRQTALIVLMAQAGCFVPCTRAEIGVCDRIFTRIGASDNLSEGQSTFFVEMSELAYILNTASAKSLVILDEIGRGTSTYDGLSIAWAVAEHLCAPERRVRTLFATHYHELTVLEGSLPGLRNLNVAVSEQGDDVVFLHRIVEGSASRSYGIHVARLAGVPKSVLTRASERLAELEGQGGDGVSGTVSYAKQAGGQTDAAAGEASDSEQLSFFSFVPDPVVERLKALDLMEIKPSEAFRILEELKEAAEKDR